jgi:Tol biopolymer transport system component
MDAVPHGAAVQVVDGPGFFDFLPDWAPNVRIAFSSDRGDGDQNGVFSIKSDGSKLRRLTPPELFAGSPGWSPNGRAIAAVDNFCGACPESDVFVFDLVSGEIRQLTDSPDNESFPDFSPDGERIAYDAGTVDVPNPGDFGATDIYVIDADGGEPANLTNSPKAFDVHADWEP